jgi:hypothetical protein
MSVSHQCNPWTWRPSKVSWYQQLSHLISFWYPQEVLGLDRLGLLDRLTDAVSHQEDWVLHPCINPLTLPYEGQRLQRDFQLAIWIAAHTEDPLGVVHVPHTLWAWSPNGGEPILSGDYDLRELGAAVANHQWPCAIALDVWCDSIGFPFPESWAARADISDEEKQMLQGEIALFLRTICFAEDTLVDCMQWATSVTQVVIPLYRQGDNSFRSGSQDNLPGLIYADIGGGVELLEALVHESAHRHLFLAECDHPLVDPNHQGRYVSPLRPEPRPLRGILLAYHALAYICALYVDCIDKKINATAYCVQELSALQMKLEQAEQTLASNQQFLTDSGKKFFDLTREVACYGRS